MKRTYVKRRIWHLGDRKKQKGDFSPIVGALARALLVSVADAVGGEVLKRLGRNIFGGRKRRFRRRTRRVKRFSYA